MNYQLPEAPDLSSHGYPGLLPFPRCLGRVLQPVQNSNDRTKGGSPDTDMLAGLWPVSLR